MSKSRGSPRKFSEKIALLNRKEAEATAEFEKIIKEVEETTRAPTLPQAINGTTIATAASPNQCSSNSWSDNGYFDEGQSALESVFEQYDPLHGNPFHLQQQNQQQLQMQLQQLPNQQIAGVGMPAQVPSIEIIPIRDDSNDFHQQQVPNYAGQSYISSARSLPDIANLRVSSTTFNQMNPSYSDQRISNDYDYEYDTNSNIVTDSNCSAQTYSLNANNQIHLQDTDSNWNNPTISFDSHSNQNINQNHYYEQSQSEQMVKANSTNAVLGSWQNTDTLSPTRLNCNFSKSSEVCHGYAGHNPSDNCFGSCSNNNSQMITSHRPRSSSYNNIENFHFHNGNSRIERSYPQQPHLQPQQYQPQQQLFVDTQLYHD